MRILLLLPTLLFASLISIAQEKDSTTAESKKIDYKNLKLPSRANDHFMIQFGYDGWSGRPDSINTTGFSRHFNAYVMLDKPFKSDPRFSVGFGAGIGSSNIFFEKTKVVMGATTSRQRIQFLDVSDTTHFRKYKVTNVWVEAPIELRFVAKPLNNSKSLKIALGVKVGTMVSAHTKGRNLRTSAGQSIHGTKYIEKVKDRAFFNSTRLAGTIRVGYGVFGLYGAYQITGLFKEGQGPSTIRPYSIGLSISGL